LSAVPATPPADAPVTLDRRRSGTTAAGAFVVVSAVLAVWVWASHRFFAPAGPEPAYEFPGDRWLRGWTHFDAGWYRDIADNGYRLIEGAQSNVAFFPLYPMAMRALRDPFGSSLLAGIAITFTAGLVSAVLFWRWCGQRQAPTAQRLSLALLLVSPYAWYLYGAVYADALFLACSLAAFTALERDRTVLAGLLGALATATRPVGPAIVLALVVRQLERRDALRTTTRRWRGRTWTLPVGVDVRRLQPADAAVLLSAAGFLAFSAMSWRRWGDPFAFSTVQRYWDQPSGPETWLKLDLAGTIVFHLGDNVRYVAGCLLQGALAVGALLLVPRIRRAHGWGYAVLVLVSMGIPVIGSKDFQGLGRYLLAAFPVYALGGTWLAGRSVPARRLLVGTSALLLLLWSHLYARGYYVA
jgi:hypothetical protein